MSRVAVAVMFVAVSGLLARVPSAAICQEVPKATKAAIKERDRLRDEYQKLRAAGKTTEAIAVAEAVLAIERGVLPDGHDDRADSLRLLAEISAEREDFAEDGTVKWTMPYGFGVPGVVVAGMTLMCPSRAAAPQAAGGSIESGARRARLRSHGQASGRSSELVCGRCTESLRALVSG